MNGFGSIESVYDVPDKTLAEGLHQYPIVESFISHVRPRYIKIDLQYALCLIGWQINTIDQSEWIITSQKEKI